MMRLQNRWKVEGKHLVYFGMRRAPYTNQNRIRISAKERDIILSLPDGKTGTVLNKKIKSLIEQGIIVEEPEVRKTPHDLESAVFCKSCIANDFIVPGIEFNSEGLCPMCAASEQDKNLVAVLPVKQEIPKSSKSRFDAAVFYTGGKDSAYLLYYCAKVLNLRVLALTWEIPFMSDNARKSIENAKRYFKNVEFVNRIIAADDLNKFYKKLLEMQNNTCACPSLAYAIFYPVLCQERIPYLILGNEPVQMKQLYYNNLAPKTAYRFQNMVFLNGLLNFFRILTFKKPLKSGQREMLMLIKQLAYGDGLLKRISGYRNEIVGNICKSMDEMKNLKSTLKKAIRQSDRKALMPSLVHIDLDLAYGGKYDWRKVKDLLIEECGWVPPAAENKSLHTSCMIETAKDYSQFVRFYNMESTVIPFSALEISLASKNGNISRENALAELKNHLGFSLTPPKEYAVMLSCNGCRLAANDKE